MPSALPRVDESTHWPPCAGCHRIHRPGTDCPPIGVWLVLALCDTCDEKSGTYCYTHRGRT